MIENVNSIQQAYDKIASIFDHRSWAKFWENNEKPEVLSLLKERGRPTKKLLDVGCGTGMYMQDALSFCSQYYGLDISEEMIKCANEKRATLPPDLSERAYLCVNSMLKMPFQNETFDAVIVSKAISHYSHPAKIFSEIVRVTETDGLIMIVDVHARHGKPYGIFRLDHGEIVAKIKNYLRFPENDCAYLSNLNCSVSTVLEISLTNCKWQPSRESVLGNLWDKPTCPILYIVTATKDNDGNRQEEIRHIS